ncbi:MAG: HTH domain-containing protein [Terrisporobacter sp.]|uniref:helix-turn-helix transcriptional regulator n=1 Tax=Terrisporobacter sp. TaxID=1965305 RepID=UPI002FC71387
MINIKGRQIELLIFLLKNKKTTYKNLAQIFEVSIKTIERDINCLSSIGVPIYCLQGIGGGVFIDENYKLSQTFFTNKDIHNIIYALTIFDQITGAKNKDEILMKLCLIDPNLTNIVEKDANNYFITDLIDETTIFDEDISKVINYCLDKELYITLYLNCRNIVVAPISYILKPDGMYLYCFDKEYKLIKMNSITKCNATDIEFIRDFKHYNKNKKYNSG